MQSSVARKIIEKMLGDLATGINTEVNIADLKELRPFAIEEKDPTVTKTIRLLYEHLDFNGTFNIPIPEEEEEEEEEVVEAKEEGAETTEVVEEVKEKPVVVLTDEDRRESLAYLVALFKNPRNKINRAEIMVYRDALMAYGKR